METSQSAEHAREIERAREAVAAAEALVVTAGAGMGVDSGLPDFRGDDGFWKAYPPFRALGLSFVDLANPRWFRTDPHLAWGFYGHRLNAYRAAMPHVGFDMLRAHMERMPQRGFVFTSNVDGQFQRAGFHDDAIVECHGSLHHMQCARECGAPIASAAPLIIAIDASTMRARDPLPACSACSGLLRPNVLMFGDGAWEHGRTLAQERRLEAFLARVPIRRIVVIELGAGNAVPTVRHFGESLCRLGATLVRINPRESDVRHVDPARAIAIPLGARDAIARVFGESQ